MGHYKPERAKTRAVWLYNHILRTRASFMKLARRKLYKEYKYSTESKYTFRNWLDSCISLVIFVIDGIARRLVENDSLINA